MQIAPIKCHSCFNSIDAVTTDIDKPSAKGDIKICIYCGHEYVFDEQLNLRDMRSCELESLQRNMPKVYFEIRRIQQFIETKIKQN